MPFCRGEEPLRPYKLETGFLAGRADLRPAMRVGLLCFQENNVGARRAVPLRFSMERLVVNCRKSSWDGAHGKKSRKLVTAFLAGRPSMGLGVHQKAGFGGSMTLSFLGLTCDDGHPFFQSFHASVVALNTQELGSLQIGKHCFVKGG